MAACCVGAVGRVMVCCLAMWGGDVGAVVAGEGPLVEGVVVGAEGSSAVVLPVVDLETFVVVGDKLERDLQLTFSSVGLVTAETLAQQGVRDLRDSFRLLGNVQSVSANNGNSGFSIRGINSEGLGLPGGNLRPLASLSIDGAPQSFEGIRRGARGAWDVAQVEVFRGPQSTLAGRNALAGAIAVRTNDPTRYFEAAALTEVGQLGLRRAAAMVSGPLAGDSLSFRVAAEVLRRELGIEYSNPVGEALDDEEFSQLRGKLRWVPFGGNRLSFQASVSRVEDRPAVAAVNRADPFARKLNVVDSTAELRENEILSTTLEGRLELTEGWTLASTSSFTQTDAGIRTPSSVYVREEVRADEDFTQDLRVTFSEGPGSWGPELMGGLFYGRLANERDSRVRIFAVGNPLLPPFRVQDLESSSRNENVGVYAEAGVPLGSRWRVSGGARYDVEWFETDFFNRISGQRTLTDGSFAAFLPRGSLAYRVTDAVTLAGTISRGYRAGFSEEGRLVDPEFLTSYELAVRSQWWSRRLTANFTGFYYDWRDQQISVPSPVNPLLTVTDNAGRSRAWGGEFEVGLVSGARWQVGASLGYLRTELVEYGGLEGNEFPEAPRYSGSVWGRWEVGGGWFLASDWSFQGSFFGTGNLVNDPGIRVPAYAIVNGSVGYRVESWEVKLAVRNVLDRQYLTGLDVNTGTYVGDPRNLALSLSLRL